MRKKRAQNWGERFREVLKQLDVDSYIEVIDDRQENRKPKIKKIIQEEGYTEGEDIFRILNRREGKKIWRIFRLGGTKTETSIMEKSCGVPEVSGQSEHGFSE